MSPITPEDLPEEIRAILDQPVEEGACVRDQPVCTPDIRVTAQLTDKQPERVVLPWRLANANKGELLVVPGGSAGMIGGLLSQIDPPQYFSHMAIMTKEQVELRQATANQDRLMKFPHYAGSEGDPGISLKFVPAIGDAPTDGFQETPLRNGWPGTITQSVERAYLTWLRRPTVKDDGDDVPDPKFSELDTLSGERFFIDDVTFAPVQMMVNGKLTAVHPLIVKPCPALETDAVRSALDRVAEAAKELYGHYRFYSYTRAAIGVDKSYLGVQVLETKRPDPESKCTGQRPLVDVGGTVPMVCSSFIWLAVQKANESLPRIVLDGRNEGRQPSNPREYCRSFLERSPNIDKIDGQTADGLYFYGRDERIVSGQWMHEYLRKTVLKTIGEDADLQGQFDDLFKGSGTSWDIWSITKLLSAFPVPTAAAILGIGSAVLEKLIVILSDMPDDVANQVTNAFASDDCWFTAKDSDAWQEPGVGYAVSPDNIINSWVSPTSEDGEVIHGIYGYNERAILRPPEVNRDPPPPSTWQISQGFGSLEGRVKFRGVGIHGATVRLGCNKLVTGEDGAFFRRDLPAGTYWGVASYVHPDSNLLLESKGTRLTIPADGGSGHIFELDEPPDTRREVWFEGHMDLVNRYAIGKDWWDHPAINLKPAYLGLDLFPNEPGFKEVREQSMRQERGDQHQVDDWGKAEIKLELEIQPDKSIKVTAHARLKEIEDDPWQQEETFPVPPKANNSDPGLSKTFDVVRSEMAWPVRAHIELIVHNNRGA